MKKNTSNTDRGVRVLGAIGLVALNLSGIVKSPASILVWVVAAILALTALVGTCPLYTLFGINTRTRKKINLR